jgi:hypothetical protein
LSGSVSSASTRGAVVVRERLLNRVRVVHEIEHEHIVLLPMRAVEARERLHRLGAREQLVHVHRVQQRLVVAGLELVGADEEPVRVFLDPVRDLAGWKPIERRLAHFGAAVLVLARECDDRFVATLALGEVVADRMEVLDRALDAARHHHRARLAADLVQRQHLLVEVIDHDLGLEPHRVVVGLHVAAQLLLCALGSNSGSDSTFFTSL